MFYEGLHFLKELPSPEGVWEKVQVIGELVRIFGCQCGLWLAGLIFLKQLLASCMVVLVSRITALSSVFSLLLYIECV